MQRVQKLLSNYGYCSRRKAEELIKDGKVKINGKTITIGDKASEDDKITVNNEIIKKEKKRYIMFHKPLRCVTALRDRKIKTIMEYIHTKERVFPIGRLDYYTSGLLLLTNDGDFANNIMHPRYEINKTYAVKLNKDLTNEDKDKIEKGIIIDDQESKGRILKNEEYIHIQIHEGRNRIIRKIFNSLGYKVIWLKRIKIGELELGRLKIGEYKELSKKEKERIFMK